VRLSRVIKRRALPLLLLALTGTIASGHLVPGRYSPASAIASEERKVENVYSLAANQQITRDLRGNESHTYPITLKAGEFFQAALEQEGIDIRITVLDTAQVPLTEIDCRPRQPTPISIIADRAGAYNLKVTAADEGELQGRYSLGIVEMRPATPNDQDRIDAERTLAEADRLAKTEQAGSSSMAISKYEEASRLAESAGDLRANAYSLRRIGDVSQSLGRFENALKSYEQALAANKQASDRRGEGTMRNQISSIHITLGQNDKARKQCLEALKLSQATRDRAVEAEALNNLGEIHNWSGELQTALSLYERALSIWNDLRDRRGQAQTQLYLGFTYSDLGQPREAFRFYHQALSLWQSAHDRRGEAITLTAIGRLYFRVGESQEALNFFERALPIVRSVGDPIEEGRILNGMASTYGQLGELPKAIEHYRRVISLFHEAGYAKGEGANLFDAGRIYASLGETDLAIDHFQRALEISRAVGDRRMQAFELNEIGRAYYSLGQTEKAIDHCLRALSFWRAGKEFRAEADTLNPLGQMYASQARRQLAEQSFNRALLLSRQAEYPFGEAAALHNIARLERDHGNLAAARLRSEEALRIIETLREKVNNPELRTSYFASVRQQQELYIDVLMKLHRQHPAQGFDYAAFEASERTRARSLLETLTAARVGVRDPANPALLENERVLNQQISDLAGQRMKLAREGKAGDEAAAVAKQIDELVWQLREVEAQIRASSTGNTLVATSQPLDLRHIQERVLDEDSVLLEYLVGDERSYVWAVTRREIFSYELPPRAEIEAAARKFRELLTANQPQSNETFQQHEQRVGEARAQFPEVALSLSNMLITPVHQHLTAKRLLIVPDGALHFVPFQALPVPAGPPHGERMPLLLNYEIVYEPSASALAYVRDGHTRPAGPKSIAVFANPVFDADDSRVTTKPARDQANPDQTLGPVFRDLELFEGRFRALPASRDEAEAIMSFAPWGTGLKVMGFDANRAAVTKPELAEYRIVHFATHGVVDYENPALSGLVLSLVDREGQPQNGFLSLNDIYNLRLSASLVVLSACNTGLGKEIKGEGLIGLTRGFMYAGAGGVAASLWKVDDEATAELMTRFYEGMFKKGLRPSAAMREAQLWMRQQRRWQEPYFWAAFIIQGRYDQTEIATAPNSRAQWLVTSAGLFGVCLLGACLFLRKKTKSPSLGTIRGAAKDL
jgi:CHAT domain-containing protein/tetratricopeptide (TPR) repeat protein